MGRTGRYGSDRTVPPLRAADAAGRTGVRLPTQKRGDGHAASSTASSKPAARVDPPCPHFGACGGCVAQHWTRLAYIALEDRSSAAAAAPRRLRRCCLSRRRMHATRRTAAHGSCRCAARRRASWLGCTGARIDGRRSVNPARCCIPLWLALIAPLRACSRGLRALRRHGSAVANLLDDGADLLLRTDATPTLADRLA